jgi:hypothetical protein
VLLSLHGRENAERSELAATFLSGKAKEADGSVVRAYSYHQRIGVNFKLCDASLGCQCSWNEHDLRHGQGRHRFLPILVILKELALSKLFIMVVGINTHRSGRYLARTRLFPLPSSLLAGRDFAFGIKTNHKVENLVVPWQYKPIHAPGSLRKDGVTQ